MNTSEIKQVRFNLDMSQAQFAKALSVTIHTVQSWEQDINKPSERSEYKIMVLENDHIKKRDKGIK